MDKNAERILIVYAVANTDSIELNAVEEAIAYSGDCEQ
jgi:hypothetical protein